MVTENCAKICPTAWLPIYDNVLALDFMSNTRYSLILWVIAKSSQIHKNAF